MKQIPLTQGKFALVDDEDFDRLSQHKWRPNRQGYAITDVRRGVGWGTRSMHRIVLSPPSGWDVDHINGDRLDNRKENLRACSRAENSRNSVKHRDNTSGYKGVSWHEQKGKWRARIRRNGKEKHLGLFETADAAARAYDQSAKVCFGVFAKLNFKEE